MLPYEEAQFRWSMWAPELLSEKDRLFATNRELSYNKSQYLRVIEAANRMVWLFPDRIFGDNKVYRFQFTISPSQVRDMCGEVKFFSEWLTQRCEEMLAKLSVAKLSKEMKVSNRNLLTISSFYGKM